MRQMTDGGKLLLIKASRILFRRDTKVRWSVGGELKLFHSVYATPSESQPRRRNKIFLAWAVSSYSQVNEVNSLIPHRKTASQIAQKYLESTIKTI